MAVISFSVVVLLSTLAVLRVLLEDSSSPLVNVAIDSLLYSLLSLPFDTPFHNRQEKSARAEDIRYNSWIPVFLSDVPASKSFRCVSRNGFYTSWIPAYLRDVRASQSSRTQLCVSRNGAYTSWIIAFLLDSQTHVNHRSPRKDAHLSIPLLLAGAVEIYTNEHPIDDVYTSEDNNNVSLPLWGCGVLCFFGVGGISLLLVGLVATGDASASEERNNAALPLWCYRILGFVGVGGILPRQRAPPVIPRYVGPVRITSVIGKGGFGTVYEGFIGQRKYAVKRGAQRKEIQKHRILSERSSTVIGFRFAINRDLILERADCDFHRFVAGRPHIVENFAMELCRLVRTFHRDTGFVHGDISSKNFLVLFNTSRSVRFKLCDFDSSFPRERKLQLRVFTPRFASSNVRRGGVCEFLDDYWAVFWVLFYESRLNLFDDCPGYLEGSVEFKSHVISNKTLLPPWLVEILTPLIQCEARR